MSGCINIFADVLMEVAERLRPPTADEPQWQSLGPTTIPNGQTYGASRVNVSGRISSVVVDPRNPAHVLVGAANGGVWESFDRSASWSPRSDFAATLTVGAIAFDPSNSSIVYCGTGEGNAWYNAPFGVGILRSVDGGTTWLTHCTNPFVGQGFYDLDIDPANGQHLIAATTNGLYVSTDGGINWIQRKSSTTWSLSIAPAGGASAEILAACSDGLWSSTDGGINWSLTTLPSSPGNFDRLAVDIAPSNPSVAYAWGASGENGYLWRRSGGVWTVAGNPSGVEVGQAWYDWFVAAAPDRDTQVYCGAISVHRGDLSGATWTWIDIASKPAGDSIHPDQHAITFEPGNPETIYIGNDGGLFLSNNRGINWQHCNNGLVISEFEYLAQDYGSSRWLIGGTQDNGTQRWTGSPIWEHIADGDGGDCGVNRTNPNTVFHTYYGMSPERSGSSGNFDTWTSITPPVPRGEGSPFYPPFETSATNGDTISIGGDAVYVSRNNGTNWTRLTYPSGARSSALYIPNADNVYVGTTNGSIFQTKWNGSSWTTLTALTTPRAGAYVSDIFVDPNNLSRLWVTHRTVGGGRVFRSDNGGSSWLDLTTGLPGLPINAIEVDPENANRIWVAADLGVYQSLDGGNSWTDFSNGLPNMYVGDLLFHPHARVLRAGTRNRGVWEIPVDGWMTQPTCAVQFTGSLAANQTGRWFTFNWPATWHILWTVMPTNPRPGSPQVSWKVEVERANAEYVTYWIVVTNLTPEPVSFEGRYCILSRY
jgi:ligand-binding sensor domain-containing protein